VSNQLLAWWLLGSGLTICGLFLLAMAGNASGRGSTVPVLGILIVAILATSIGALVLLVGVA
jgi:hypothetical protein